MFTDNRERMFDDESTISHSQDSYNTTTPQDHSTKRAKFDRTRAWEVLGFWGVTKVTSSDVAQGLIPPQGWTRGDPSRQLGSTRSSSACASGGG